MYARAPGSASGAVAILSREAERYLRESGLTYTILAPNMFMEGWIPILVGLPLYRYHWSPIRRDTRGRAA